ncbi:MAG TPA: hypothetical protein VIS94_04840 [Desulfomonilia bacterium]|jgi:hypothetical protein
MRYVHPVLFEEVNAIGGHYTFVKEGTLLIKNRKVLYYVGLGSIDTSCCGVGGCIYAYVPGYIIESGVSENEADGRSISEISAVEREGRAGIADILKLSENVTQVIFMTDKGSSEALF